MNVVVSRPGRSSDSCVWTEHRSSAESRGGGASTAATQGKDLMQVNDNSIKQSLGSTILTVAVRMF